MTPPLVPVSGPSTPVAASVPSQPLPEPQPASPPFSADSSPVALNGDSGSYRSKEDFQAALSDPRLFGSALKDYEAEKSGKYLRVSLALDSIRSAISGEGKSAVAVQRISMWLSEPSLLTDKAVAHVARVNLVKALSRAKAGGILDEGGKAILDALQKNYSTSAPKQEETQTSKPADLAAQLEDANLFGDRLQEYETKRNKEYVAVNLALLEIRKVATGQTKDLEPAKIRIEKWLRDAALLTDKVPHRARVNLIKVLGAAPGSEGMGALIAALKADYSVKGSEKEKEAPAPRPEVKESREKGITSYSVKPNSKPKEARTDTANTFSSGLNLATRPVLNHYLARNPNFSLSAEMTVRVEESTGRIVGVRFESIKSQASDSELKGFFGEVANSLRSRFCFKAGTFDSGGFGFIKVKVNYVSQ